MTTKRLLPLPPGPISRRGLLVGSLGFGALSLVSGRAKAAQPARGTRVRLGDHGASTRFVLELTEAVTWSTVAVDGPPRLILDIPGITLSLRDPLPTLGVIAGIRTGRQDPDVARFVFDLAVPALPDKDFLIEPRDGFGWRLVIDLVPVEKSLFLASTGVVPPPAVPRTLDPAPSTRLAGLPVPAGKPGGSASATGTPAIVPPSVTAPLPAPAAAGKPVYVRLANGRRVPVPVGKPEVPSNRFMPNPVIVLDPGHGGRDPGAISTGGVYEKTITLAMARDLKAALEKTGRYQVLLTRSSDTAVPLRDRIDIGRKAGGDLFISLHADALSDTGVRGVSVYTLSETASDAEAAALAERENKADILVNADLSNQSPDVATILIDLAQRATLNNSALFAGLIIRNLPADISRLSKPHRSAGFAVLKAPDMPSVLVEMGFLSNVRDEKLLRDTQYRTKLADAIVKSVEDYMAVQQQSAFQP